MKSEEQISVANGGLRLTSSCQAENTQRNGGLPTCQEQSPEMRARLGSDPSLTDLAVAMTVQEIVADVSLKHSLPLLSGVGRGQTLGCRKAKGTSLNVEKNVHRVGCFKRQYE